METPRGELLIRCFTNTVGSSRIRTPSELSNFGAPIKISNQFNDHKWNDWAIDAPETLALPKRFWRLTTALRSRLRAAWPRKLAPAGMAAPASPKVAQLPETGSFDLGEDRRQRVKKLLVLVALAIERVLAAADIRRAMRHHVHLSAEGRTDELVAQMSDRLQATDDDLWKSRRP